MNLEHIDANYIDDKGAGHDPSPRKRNGRTDYGLCHTIRTGLAFCRTLKKIEELEKKLCVR